MSLFRKDEPEYCLGGRRSFISRLWYKTKNLGRKLKDTAAVVSGKRFANNKKYEGASRVSQESVETNPERWIIKECIPACKILWDKNIYTFMCSDYGNSHAWIELDLDNLSSENLEILEEVKKDYNCYSYHYGCINIEVDGMGKSAMEELVKVASRFVMQDVPKKEATISLKSLLIKSGCYKKIKNPKYTSFEEEIAKMMSKGWGASMEEEYIYEYDESKLTKPVEEYISEYGGYVDETGTIYRSRFHYDKHLNYLRALDKDNGDSGIRM